MNDVVITNFGLVINNSEIEKQLKVKNLKTNLVFISSAVASMVNDRPNSTEVSDDVFKIQIVGQNHNKSYSICDFLLEKILKSNNNRILEYFKLQKYTINNYLIKFKENKISNLMKCGALITKNGIIFRKMGINDSHIQTFDRDFIGFFVNLNSTGNIVYKNNEDKIISIKFIIGKIPLLCFKSENAFKTVESKQICCEMANNLCSKDAEIIYC